MIKKIIFDLDNTLIMWKEEYLNALKKTIDKYNIKEDPQYIIKLIDDYEDIYDNYNKENLLNFINQNIKSKLNMDFIDDFLYNIGFMSESNDDVNRILEYLSQKYELAVLTNWFKEPQERRLETAKIKKYFHEIYGGEKYQKPDKRSFMLACGEYKPEQCVMIGDNYEKDIIGAHNSGLNVIYYNYSKKQDNKLKLIEINELSQLKEIL